MVVASGLLVLVIGVEHMTANDGAAIGRNLLKASYVKEEADTPGGFAAGCMVAAAYSPPVETCYLLAVFRYVSRSPGQ